MKPRPTLQSLRAGQTLYIVDANLTADVGEPVGNVVCLSNDDIREIRRRGERFPWAWTYYSQRRALSSARRLVIETAALQRDEREAEEALISRARQAVTPIPSGPVKGDIVLTIDGVELRLQGFVEANQPLAFPEVRA